jgi:hypothetical protein
VLSERVVDTMAQTDIPASQQIFSFEELKPLAH